MRNRQQQQEKEYHRSAPSWTSSFFDKAMKDFNDKNVYTPPAKDELRH